MIFLTTATVIAWIFSVWCGLGVLRIRGLVPRCRRGLAALGWMGLGVVLGALMLTVHALHAFSGETLVAHVTTQRLSQETFDVLYTPVGPEVAPVRVPLQGDQWAISGGIVKWHPWLTALGLKNYHKPLRLSGQFSSLAQQRSHTPTVYALEPSGDWIWETLYRLAPHLPLIEAVYGSSAYVYVEPSIVQDVYVTPSGYLVKRAPSPTRHPF